MFFVKVTGKRCRQKCVPRDCNIDKLDSARGGKQQCGGMTNQDVRTHSCAAGRTTLQTTILGHTENLQPRHTEKSDPIRAAQTSSGQSSDSRGTSHGPALAAGASSVNAVCTAPTTKKYGQKRAGAKAIKRMEQESAEYKLSSKDATNLRALCKR